ncbi:MAG: hypothetical protein QF492_08095 [Candidatus Krumholzibacteria bacterium]|jgi:hypothetical protein|nr:hypothetical protein [Candidatus Krumholzibacteria bacterium]MDP6669848.1 hypothetical protein [Candidatus Krumholzibacteria bacterium]MDP6796849.1 hypothetical protein [Candidatus Krumholzibacteria bacterium]MDP7022268.1 hypothetical protein [Candidatus Krumholzibacteria bacterium]
MRITLLVIAMILAVSHATASTTSTGISRDFNPAISANGLILYSSGSLGETDEHEHEGEHSPEEGLRIQETELQLSANVDPYSKAVLTFAMHGSSAFELEEGYLQTRRLPAHLGLKVGRFLWDFGKHNQYHSHQFPFVEKPHAWEELLGEHGLAGEALQMNWLSPLPWFAELSATAFPLNHSVYGEHAEAPENHWGKSLHLAQLFETGKCSTLELGGSWLSGPVAHEHEEEIEEGDREFLGFDATWKWIGSRANAKQLEIQGEWIRRSDRLGEEDITGSGWYLSSRAKVSRRFWIGARYDSFHSPSHEDESGEHEHSGESSTIALSLAFVASEFQAWRMDLMKRAVGEGTYPAIRLQANFTIGSHPAHRY